MEIFLGLLVNTNNRWKLTSSHSHTFRLNSAWLNISISTLANCKVKTNKCLTKPLDAGSGMHNLFSEHFEVLIASQMLTEGSVHIQTCLHHSDDSSAATVELGRYCRSWSTWWTVMKWMTEYIPAQGCASTHRNTPSSQSQKVEWRNSSTAFCSSVSQFTKSYNLIGLNQPEVYKVLAHSVFSTSCMLHITHSLATL